MMAGIGFLMERAEKFTLVPYSVDVAAV
jgi:hypothetical protein